MIPMKKTICIVDDFKNTRFVIRFTLQNAGYRVEEAEDGKEALKLFDGRKIDLLITDLNMPNMNGIQLVKAIKKMPHYQFIPTLILTTETDEKRREEAKEAGVTGWIKKPFDSTRFLKIIEKAIK